MGSESLAGTHRALMPGCDNIRNRRIQLISDLHLKNYPDFVPRAAQDIDVLILAGDIGSYQVGSLLEGDDFGLSRFSPRRPALTQRLAGEAFAERRDTRRRLPRSAREWARPRSSMA